VAGQAPQLGSLVPDALTLVMLGDDSIQALGRLTLPKGETVPSLRQAWQMLEESLYTMAANSTDDSALRGDLKSALDTLTGKKGTVAADGAPSVTEVIRSVMRCMFRLLQSLSREALHHAQGRMQDSTEQLKQMLQQTSQNVQKHTSVLLKQVETSATPKELQHSLGGLADSFSANLLADALYSATKHLTVLTADVTNTLVKEATLIVTQLFDQALDDMLEHAAPGADGWFGKLKTLTEQTGDEVMKQLQPRSAQQQQQVWEMLSDLKDAFLSRVSKLSPAVQQKFRDSLTRAKDVLQHALLGVETVIEDDLGHNILSLAKHYGLCGGDGSSHDGGADGVGNKPSSMSMMSRMTEVFFKK